MRNLVGLATLVIAGGVTTGLVVTQTPAVADEAFQRKDDMVEVVMAVDDEDDDDTFARDDDTGDTSVANTTGGTGSSRSRADGTNSRYSPLSRDRDKSRGDKTRDWTRDGGDRTRDWSRNATNDRSRNDTRRGARA